MRARLLGPDVESKATRRWRTGGEGVHDVLGNADADGKGHGPLHHGHLRHQVLRRPAGLPDGPARGDRGLQRDQGRARVHGERHRPRGLRDARRSRPAQRRRQLAEQGRCDRVFYGELGDLKPIEINANLDGTRPSVYPRPPGRRQQGEVDVDVKVP